MYVCTMAMHLHMYMYMSTLHVHTRRGFGTRCTTCTLYVHVHVASWLTVEYDPSPMILSKVKSSFFLFWTPFGVSSEALYVAVSLCVHVRKQCQIYTHHYMTCIKISYRYNYIYIYNCTWYRLCSYCINNYLHILKVKRESPVTYEFHCE